MTNLEPKVGDIALDMRISMQHLKRFGQGLAVVGILAAPFAVIAGAAYCIDRWDWPAGIVAALLVVYAVGVSVEG